MYNIKEISNPMSFVGLVKIVFSLKSFLLIAIPEGNSTYVLRKDIPN